jgi:hypothetical protein
MTAPHRAALVHAMLTADEEQSAQPRKEEEESEQRGVVPAHRTEQNRG